MTLTQWMKNTFYVSNYHSHRRAASTRIFPASTLMMSSSNETTEHGEASSQPGRDNQSHDTSHANAQASGSSHQWNGNANTYATISSHPPYPQDPGGVFVEETIQRTIRTGLGGRLMPPPLGSRGQETRHLSRSPATSSLPRSPVEGVSTTPFLAPPSTESPKGGLATFQEAVLRFLIDVGSFTTFCLVIYLFCQIGSSNPSQTAHVQCGVFNSWVDYDYSILWRWRITLSDDQASCFILSTVAILILLIPSTYNLVSRIGNRILWRFTRSVRVGEQNSEPNTLERDPEADDENTPLMIKREQRSWVWFSVSKILVSSRSANHTIRGLMTLVLGTSLQEQGYESSRPATTLQGIIALVLSVSASIIFLALVFAALMSKRLAVGSVVLSQHPDCGVWWFSPDPSSKSDQSTSYGWSSFGQEVEAGEYARKCYHSSPGTDGCNSFLARKIPYDKYPNNPCPFEESLCLEGRSSAYSLTTGIISAKDLGINVPIGYSFRRNTTCSPVSRRAILSDDLKAFNYEYGASRETASGNITWTSNANPSWDFAGYNVATFYWTDNSTRDWEPNAEFKPWTHHAITLMFIQSQENYHREPRRDPIFPAEQEVLYGPKKTSKYFNADPIVPALACVDTTEICSPNGSRCWTDLSTLDVDPPSLDEKIGYYMLALALTESTTFNAIQLQGGRTLEATHMLQRFLSFPLADEQWKVEAEHLFETSLARISITLRNYIRGAAAHIPNYKDETAAAMGGMCHAYKLPGRGWVNIPVSGIILITCLASLSYILSFEIGSYSVVRREVTTKHYQRNVDIQTMLVIDWILDAILGPAGIPADERYLTGEYTSIPRPIIDGWVDRATSPLSIPADQTSQRQASSENAGSQTESQVAVGAETENEHRAPAETEE